MARFGTIIGLLVMAAGVASVAYGGPYYMLDWGGTFIVSGLVGVAGGLVLLMLSALLRQLQMLNAAVGALRAAVPVPDPSARVTASPDPVPPTAATPLSPPDIPAAEAAPGHVPAIALAAGAGAVAAGGLATAAASILNSVSNGPEQQAQDALHVASDTATRDDLFGRVDQAVRALKDEAGHPHAATRPDEFADLRLDLSARGATPGDMPGNDVADGHEALAAPLDEAASSPAVGTSVTEPEEATVSGTPEAAASATASADSGPAASDEGVVAAYTVGDTSYTMFADGRIRADTPEGERHFAGMDELKAHMATRRGP